MSDEPYKFPPLWFRQSAWNTFLLLIDSYRPWQREWWRVLSGRCDFCGKRDCID